MLIAFLLGNVSLAQHPGFQHPGHPGAPVREYFQPVRISGPEGTHIALAINETFVQRRAAPYAVGLLLGMDYRMRVTDIPYYPGKEVFPTVQVLQRTFPPQGMELEYPILIDITQEDIELALDGKFVTRVIYLEDPRSAMPIRGDLGPQPSVDVVSGADPIDVAATLGQPVAILRLGGRIPNTLGTVDPMFFHGSPSWIAIDRNPVGQYEISLFQNIPRQIIPVEFMTAPNQSGAPGYRLNQQPYFGRAPSVPIY